MLYSQLHAFGFCATIRQGVSPQRTWFLAQTDRHLLCRLVARLSSLRSSARVALAASSRIPSKLLAVDAFHSSWLHRPLLAAGGYPVSTASTIGGVIPDEA
jgi:hypothetical protein